MTESAEKKFSPHMVASFNDTQLMAVVSWAHINIRQTGLSFTKDFLRTVQTAGIDEKGKKMDEKARKRLGYGILVLGGLLARGEKMHGLRGSVQVWQTSPNEEEIELRWNFVRQLKIPA
ncbi:MAG: hypothetical protein HW400_892 [Candidatus Levybacteria bacterium]|nr:hypothetical protein [Candidatus Levybacteria bacterium]